MPMNAAGAQGFVTGTVNLSTTNGALLTSEISVYTVPNITDQFAQIDYTAFWEIFGVGSNGSYFCRLGGSIGTPGAARDMLWSTWPPVSISEARGNPNVTEGRTSNTFYLQANNNTVGSSGQFHGEIKLGPNTAFKIPVFYRNNGDSVTWTSLTLNYAVQYHSLYTKIS